MHPRPITFLGQKRPFGQHHIGITMNMSQRPIQAIYRSFDNPSCLVCQWRSFSHSYRALASPQTPSTSPPTAPIPSTLDEAPRAYGKSVDKFDPKPLSRPIGLLSPPRAGENSGVDNRTWRQRRDDFVNYDKHLVKRRIL